MKNIKTLGVFILVALNINAVGASVSDCLRELGSVSSGPEAYTSPFLYDHQIKSIVGDGPLSLDKLDFFLDRRYNWDDNLCTPFLLKRVTELLIEDEIATKTASYSRILITAARNKDYKLIEFFLEPLKTAASDSDDKKIIKKVEAEAILNGYLLDETLLHVAVNNSDLTTIRIVRKFLESEGDPVLALKVANCPIHTVESKGKLTEHKIAMTVLALAIFKRQEDRSQENLNLINALLLLGMCAGDKFDEVAGCYVGYNYSPLRYIAEFFLADVMRLILKISYFLDAQKKTGDPYLITRNILTHKQLSVTPLKGPLLELVDQARKRTGLIAGYHRR